MPKTNRPLTVVGLILALFMGALEATVIATAMPTVIGELGGIQHYAWVFTAYLLCSTVLVPIYGKLADLYGRKPILLFGIALFLLGSIASGMAQSMTQLIVFRAVQGLGAGSMQPIAITIVGDIFDLEERSRMQGLFGAAWGVAGLAGPLVGGLIVRYFSWRWVFYINVPFGIASALLVATQLHEHGLQKKKRRLDFVGAGLLAAGVVVLLFAAQGGGSVRVLSAFALTAALLTAFVIVERRETEPILPLSLFARPVIAVSSLAGAIIGGAMIGTLTYVPLLVQGVLRGSPTDAGTAITPMVIGWPVASAIAGRMIPRVGFRPLIRVGLGVTAAAAVYLAWLTRGTPTLNELRLATTLFGIGMGFANTALLIAVQTSVAWQERGVATASTMFFRTIGGTLAVGGLGGVLVAALARDSSIPADAASRVLAPHGSADLSPALLDHLGAALSSGLAQVFAIVAGMAVVAFVVSLRFPQDVPRAEDGAATSADSATDEPSATAPATKNAAAGKAS